MIDRGLRSLAGKAQQAVLVNSLAEISGKSDRADNFQPLDMRKHGAGTGRTGRKLEPGQRAVGGLTTQIQKSIERRALRWSCPTSVDSFSSSAFDCPCE